MKLLLEIKIYFTNIIQYLRPISILLKNPLKKRYNTFTLINYL